MKWSWRNILMWSLPIMVALFLIWQELIVPSMTTSNDAGKNVASSRMTYGRFLEYLDMGWVKKVDLYDNGHTAIVEAVGPDLGNRLQRIRVELPVVGQDLIPKLKAANVDIDAHPVESNQSSPIEILENLLVSVGIVAALIFLFRRPNNMGGPNNQARAFGQSNANIQMEANTGVQFDDVAGVDEAKEEFQEVVTFLKKPEVFTDLGATVPKGVLLVGPPGTGKTLLAKAIAGEAGVPFFSVSGSEFVEMFVGVGASRVRDLFKQAKANAPCIVFIDEIDAVGRQRGTGIGGGNDEREQTLNQMLTEMDGFEGNTGVIVIAATNRADILDSALLRPGRFDRQITVDVPDYKGRLAILNVHSSNKKIADDISLEAIARRTPGFSGADLANLMNEAAILTVRRDKNAITRTEIDVAIDRIVAGMEGTSLVDNKSKRLIAYHEIGHAIVGTLLKNHDDVQKVTLTPRGQARGLTWFMPSQDQTLISRSQILARIVGALGGRAAEQVVFGDSEVTTGAGNDLQQVASMTRQMVTRFGMSKIGPLSLESESMDPFLGRSMMSNSEYSDKIATDIDMQVQVIIAECYQQAINIIQTNRVIIDHLVDLLIEKETIEGGELQEIVSSYTKIPV